MSSNYSTIQQHEPLRVPSNWNTQEKKFVSQLEEVLDDIYRRFGRLRLEDMGEEFRKSFKAIGDDMSELETEININATGISTLTQKTGIGSLGTNETLYSKITTNASSITTLVNKTGINSLGQNETLYSKVTQSATDITTLVNKTGINSLGQSETLYSKISQSATDITTLVNKTGINSLGQNETLYSKINQNAQSVTLTFQKIGASGYTASGITTINENGITVTHSSMSNCKTQMNANGFRILNSGNTVIGGLMSLNGSVVTAMNALYNPSYSNFVARVGQFSGLADSIYGMQFCWRGTPYMNFGIGYIEGSVVDTEIVASNQLIVRSNTKVAIDCGNYASITVDPNNEDIFFSCSEGTIAMSTIIWMLNNGSYG